MKGSLLGILSAEMRGIHIFSDDCRSTVTMTVGVDDCDTSAIIAWQYENSSTASMGSWRSM
jgi:hypothetical protein